MRLGWGFPLGLFIGGTVLGLNLYRDGNLLEASLFGMIALTGFLMLCLHGGDEG